jgi:hypothetical protein
MFEINKANEESIFIGHIFPTTKVGERRHNYVGAPDNRIHGSFRTCPNAPGTRHKPGTWTRWSHAHQILHNKFYAELKAQFFTLS